MSIHIQYEGKLLIYSFVTGAGLMMVYDCLRILRIFVPHRAFFISVEDAFYWIYAAVTSFMLLYEENDGGLRGCVIVCIFIGMVLYDRLVSRIFLKLLKNVWKYLRMKSGKCFHKKKSQ